MVVELRYYQIDVIGRTRGHIARGAKRVIIQGSTGCGKTHIACEIIRCAVAKGSRVLFLVHRRRLVKQISDRLTLFGIPHGVIMAGVRSSPALVQVASRDTILSRSVHNEWNGFPPADLVIVDECHNVRLTGADNDDDLSGYEAILKIYPNSVILGLSATPARSSGHGLGAYFQALECVVPTSQLVREGWLVPVRCYAPERIGDARRHGKRVKGLAGNPATWWKKLADGRPTVAFTTKVDSSLALVESFNRAGIPAAHIDAHTPDEERERVIEGIQDGSISLVSNVGVIVEGVDVPELSCCILLRMAGSYVLYAQAVGRIMRAHPSKRDAVLIDHAGACYVHGLPDDDVSWTLDTEDTVDSRNKASNINPPEKKILTCPNCSCQFRGSMKCPACGYTLPKYLRPLEMREELLTEVQRHLDPVKAEEERVRYWHTCLRVMACKGRSLVAARCMWKGRFGGWPPDSLPNNSFDYSDWKLPVSELLPQYAPKRA